MRNVLFTLIALATWLTAAPLTVIQGNVLAHTEVFGDSAIDPQTNAITSYLTMSGSPETISGHVVISMAKLASDNKDRDENMHETLESDAFPDAVYMFDRVTKNDTGYTVEGQLKLHGITKPVTLQAQMSLEDGKLKMQGNGSILMTDFGIEPPVLLFLTVRDQVDIRFDVTFAAQ